MALIKTMLVPSNCFLSFLEWAPDEGPVCSDPAQDLLKSPFNRPFFDVFKFSLKERFTGQRQRKVDDMQIFFTFISTCFYCFGLHCLTIKLNI